MRFFHSHTVNDKGFALVVVLWIAGLLSLIATTFIYTVRSQVRVSSNMTESARAEYLADAGVALALNDILSAVNAGASPARFPADGTSRRCSIRGSGSLRIVVRDEAGRVDLNQAGQPLIKALLLGLGEGPDKATRLSEAILDFRDRDDDRHRNGAEMTEYLASNKPYGPKNAPFESLHEINQVLGMTHQLATKLQPHVTIHSRSAGIDPSLMTADLKTVIQRGMLSVGGLNSLDADVGKGVALPSLFVARSGGDVFSIAVQAKTLTGAQFIRIAIVDFAPKRLRSYRFREWRQGTKAEFSVVETSNSGPAPNC